MLFRATGPWLPQNCSLRGSRSAPDLAEQATAGPSSAGRSGTGPYEKKGRLLCLPYPTAQLESHRNKGAFKEGSARLSIYCRASGSERRGIGSRLNHPRLCVDFKACLIGGPRKWGSRGGRHGGRGGEAVPADCAHHLAAFWFLFGRPKRNSPPRRRNPPKFRLPGDKPLRRDRINKNHRAKQGFAPKSSF